ncbi:hypothetical protein EB001_00230 [bacterium]|nr:hypothetical protein [bacterium]
MAICVYCEQEFSDERKEAGYDYCMAHDCHLKGLDVKHREFIKEYTVALLHKSNYFWIKKDQLQTLNTRSDLLQEREDLQ